MTEAEIEARATTIADTFIESMVKSEVNSETRAQFIKGIGKTLTDGIVHLSTYFVPALLIMLFARIFGGPFFYLT